MTVNRRGEKGAVPFRSGRLFRIDDQWYFATREVAHVGPYGSRDEAEVAMAAFVGSRIHHSVAFTYRARRASAASSPPGQSETFAAMVNEAAQFFAERSRDHRNAALVWAVERLQSLRAENGAIGAAGQRAAVLEHILEEDPGADALATPLQAKSA